MDACLALRQHLKEKFRAKLRQETGGATTTGGRKENAAPTDNYGNFFGPSEIIFAGEAIQETKLWSERNTKFLKEDKKKAAARLQMEKGILEPNVQRPKVEWLKEARDYSFLSSDSDQIPVPGNKPDNSRNPEITQGATKNENEAKDSKVREIQGVVDTKTGIKTKNSKVPQIQGVVDTKTGTKTKNSKVREIQGVVDTKTETKAKNSKVSEIQGIAVHDTKTGIKTKNSKVPEIQGAVHTKTGIKTKNYRFSEIQGDKGLKISRPDKKQVSRDLKKPQQEITKGLKPVSKQEIKKKKPPLISSDQGRKRKLEERDAEENEARKAISCIIRKMYKYDPTKFCDDKDDFNMESTFADIQKEERRSAKIAKKEDEEEELKLRNSSKKR